MIEIEREILEGAGIGHVLQPVPTTVAGLGTRAEEFVQDIAKLAQQVQLQFPLVSLAFPPVFLGFRLWLTAAGLWVALQVRESRDRWRMKSEKVGSLRCRA